jgi:hypothetical protein
MASDSTGYLYITGGNLTIDADGDGIDANTDIEISGGYIVVNGPTNDGNGSLDYGENCVVTGGTLIATGSSGMAVAPTSGTTVNTIFAGFDTAQAGSQLIITDSSGQEVLNTTPTKSYSSLVYSSDSLKSKETYTITIDGETVLTVTMSDTVTSSGIQSFGGGGMGGGKPDGQNGGMGGSTPDDQNGGMGGSKPDDQNGGMGGGTPDDQNGGMGGGTPDSQNGQMGGSQNTKPQTTGSSGQSEKSTQQNKNGTL